MKPDLFGLSFRTNINVYTYRDKKVVVYSDHRTILNVLAYAQKHKLIALSPNVIYFDYHEDGCLPKKKVIELASEFDIAKNSLEDFNTIVEFEMGILDDDWVKTGMEFNLIKNAISIGAVKYDRSYTTYSDCKAREHECINISHLSQSLSERGALGDSQIVEPYYESARKIFNYNNDMRDDFGSTIQPFVLDFDLDCFSADYRDETIAWPEKMFKDELYHRTGFYNHIRPIDFINTLIDRCELITICTEPNCCGGLGESHKILNYLDKYLFGSILKTSICN